MACRVATLSRSDCIVAGLMLTRNWRPQSSLNITTPGSLCCRQFTYMQQTHQTNVSSIAQIPLGSSHHVTSRHDTIHVSSASIRACRAVCSTISTQPKCMGSTRWTCCVKMWHDEPSGMWAYKLGLTVHRCLQIKAPQYLMDSARVHIRRLKPSTP